MKSKMEKFFASLSEKSQKAILRAANLALADEDNLDELGLSASYAVDLSDEINDLSL